MKKSILFLILFISVIAVSQSLNIYKYALIESKFKFQKSANQYNLNTLTKLYFQKIGMQSFLDLDVLPTEVANENCNKIYVSAEENSNMFSTKIKIIIKDCQNKILFISDEGMSREKSYETAYNQAFRMALTSVERLKYKYEEEKQEVEENKPLIENNLNIKIENPTIVKKDIGKPRFLKTKPVNGGFLLFVENEILFEIYTTSKKDVYLAFDKTKKRNGILVKEENRWLFEYFENQKLVVEFIGNIELWKN
jgi:hypothetical protein